MTILFSFILFLVACFCVFYLPGRWILKRLLYSPPSTISTFTLSLGTGVAVFLVCTYLLAWLHATFLYLFMLTPVIMYEVISFLKDIKKHYSFTWVLCPETFILAAGIILMTSIMATSGIESNGHLIFYGTNAWDGIFHTALINNLAFQFPPSFPGLSNTFLRGYHFLYDLMLSQFVLLFRFNTFDIFFRFFTVFTALFYGLAGLSLGNELRMKPITRRVFLFLLYFAQGGEYFIFHFVGLDKLYDSGIVQPAGNIVDPSVLFSMSFVFLLFTVLWNITKKRQILLPILFLGILPGIKIYTGILAFISIGVISIIGFVKKELRFFSILFFAGILAAVIYIPFNIGAGYLIFHPFLSIRHFMEGDRIFTSFQWVLKWQYYTLHKNYIRLIYLYGIGMVIYFLPPLGLRVCTVVNIGSLFKKSFYTASHVFWLIFILTGIIFPLLFIQSIAVFNTVQFYWLTWIALLIPTAYSLTFLLQKVFKKESILYIFIILVSLPVLHIPLDFASGTYLTVDNTEASLGQMIQKNVPKQSDVLVVNRQYIQADFQPDYQVPLFGALAGRPMFYEPEQGEFAKIQTTERARIQTVDTISYLLSHCPSTAASDIHQLLVRTHVHYLVLLSQSSCILPSSPFRIVNQEGNYSLLRVL